MSNLIKVAAAMTNVRPLADGGMSLGFKTQETTRAFMVEAMELYNQFGWLLFSPNEIRLDAVPDDPASPPVGTISPSRRLKNTIYAYYIKKGAPYGKTGFEKFWSEQAERLRGIILTEMEKLDEN